MAEVVQDEISIEIKSKADDAAKSVKTLSGELKSLNTVMTGIGFAGLFKSLKQLGSTMFSFAEKTSNYIQTMNQFRIVMGDSTKEAEAFINKAEDILGLDPQKLQNSLATFKSLGESFGISSDNAYKMSKNLTQLAADMSTFKGISFEQSLQKIKSGFVGEIEPMRAVGIALDKATLQETANRLGIEQRIDAMTRAQKTELLYYQMMTATEQMQGNMAKNLLTPATAIRQIQTEFAKLGRAIGSIFIPMLMKVMPYIRAITELASEAAQAIAAMFGFKLGDYAVDVSDIGTSLGDVGAGIEDIGSGAGKATKELNKMLMPFDELNNINLENKSGGSGGGSIGGVGGSLGIPIKEYDMFANASDEMRKKIDSIKESIKQLLPIIKGVAIALGTLWVVKKILDFIIYLSKVKTAFSTLKSFIQGTKLGSLISSLGTGLKNLFWNTNLGQSIQNFKAGTGGISSVLLNIAAAVGGAIISVKGFIDMSKVMDDAWKTGTVDGMKYAGALAEISGGFALLGFSIGGLKGALIGFGIGALVGLLTSLTQIHQQSNETAKEVEKLSNKINEQKSAIDKNAESWNNLSQSTQESVNKQIAQAEYIKELVNELDELADSNGRVKDADKARVDFILNEVNKAYGTQYELTGNQITKNGEEVKSLNNLKEAINEVIKKKEAEAIINATSDKYVEALTKRSQYYKEMQKAIQNNSEAYDLLTKASKKHGISIEDLTTKEREELEAMADINQLSDMTLDGTYDLVDAYKESQKAVESSTKNWKESVGTILETEELRTAVVENNYERIDKALEKITNSYEENGQKQNREVGDLLSEQLQIYKEMSQNMTDDARKAHESKIRNTTEALIQETNTVKALSDDNIQAWKDLADYSTDVYNKSISKVSEGTQLAIKTAIGELDANSPETIQKWKKLAETSETEYNKALSLLPEDTRNRIIQATAKVYEQSNTLGQAGDWAGQRVASSTNTSFNNNLNLSIYPSAVKLQNTWGFNAIGQGIAKMIQRRNREY